MAKAISENSEIRGLSHRAYFIFHILSSSKGLKLIAYAALLLVGVALMIATLLTNAASAHAKSRIKDIVAVEGIRDNILIGYGLVVGLNGTGDKLTNAVFTEKSLQSFLEQLGVNTHDETIKAKNVAAVTVTATLPPFSRSGSRIDINVSTLGDAKSLQGGVLVATPLMGADGQVYAVGQGAVTISGFSADAGGNSVQKGVPTGGFIANGAIVEREIPFDLNSLSEINLALRNPDIGTARRVSEIINRRMGAPVAQMMDPATVRVRVPGEYEDSVARMLADIEQLEVETDQIARIIIDEASGTIVMNENVRIDTVAIAQANLTITIREKPEVRQSLLLVGDGVIGESVGETGAESFINIDEQSDEKITIMKHGPDLQELINGLNSLGVGPRDLITILQTIKVAGALQAEIETR